MTGTTFDQWWLEQGAKGDPARLDPRTIFEAGQRAARYVEPCACIRFCGDSDPEGPGTCKDLPKAHQPLVEIVLVPR